jgi:hypothetical protein
MRIGVAADSIDTKIDSITYQPGGDRIPDGTLLPERASMEKLIDISVTFHYNGLLENLLWIHHIPLSLKSSRLEPIPILR